MKEIVEYTGLGGVAVVLVFRLLKIILQKSNIISLQNGQIFKLIKIVIYSGVAITFLCVITYGFINYHEKYLLLSKKKEIQNTNTISGNNNNVINGDNNSINKTDSINEVIKK